MGSIDVDLAFNHRNLQDARYATIQELLLPRGYEQDHRQPFIFHRTVSVSGNPIKVRVDFLAGEYEGAGRAHRTQRVQDGRARKAPGCDLAFDLFVEQEIRGELPGGGADQAMVRVSSAVAFLVMKGMALHDRLKEKDAWDTYFTLTDYPGGLDALVAEFQPHIDHGLVQEGCKKSPASSPQSHTSGRSSLLISTMFMNQRNALFLCGALFKKWTISYTL